MKIEDRHLLNLLFRLLSDCEPSHENGVFRLSFQHQPDEHERKLLDQVGVLLKFHALGSDVWVTAELDDATLMLSLSDRRSPDRLDPVPALPRMGGILPSAEMGGA